MDYIFYQVAAVNGFDAFGHYLRAGLIVNQCSSYAIDAGAGLLGELPPPGRRRRDVRARAPRAAAAARTAPARAQPARARAGGRRQPAARRPAAHAGAGRSADAQRPAVAAEPLLDYLFGSDG